MMVRAAVVLLSLMLLPSHALAQKRVALLIGNQSYTSEIGRLANPHNDIALLGQTLKGLGFEVATVRDAGLAGLHQAVNAYARRVQAAGPNAVGFFYYSGHGAADGGANYLIPVDVKTTETGELWDQSMRLTEITRKLKTEAGNATHFVVFDACRNTLKLTKAGSRALMQSKGFVPVVQETGMLIAYATAEGELASDVGSGAGPYAKVLAEEIVKPGIEAVYMFRRVQVRVRATIGQEPWLGFNALGEVHLAGLETAKPPPVVVPPKVSLPPPTEGAPPPSPEAESGREIAEATKALEKNPNDAAALQKRARAYARKRQYEPALADVTKAIQLEPANATLRNFRGLVHYNLRSYEDALRDYDQAIRLEPNHTGSRNGRANTNRALKRYEAALTDYDEVIRYNPKYVASYYNRALVLIDVNRPDDAIRDLNQAIVLDRDYAGAYAQRGLLHEKSGAREQAIADFRAALAAPSKFESGVWAHNTARTRLGTLGVAVP